MERTWDMHFFAMPLGIIINFSRPARAQQESFCYDFLYYQVSGKPVRKKSFSKESLGIRRILFFQHGKSDSGVAKKAGFYFETACIHNKVAVYSGFSRCVENTVMITAPMIRGIYYSGGGLRGNDLALVLSSA